LELAAGAESGSEHPLAGSVLRAAGARGIAVPEVVGFAAVPGLGASATVQGRNLRVGSPEWLRPQGGFPEALERLVASARTCLVVEADGLVAGVIELRDALRPEAPRAVERLRALGVRTILVTGDSQAAAEEVAGDCGIDEVRARVLPEGKLGLVRSLQAQGCTVAFVGDGLNDAPSLAAADVGLAIGTGTGAAIGSAPVTIVSGNPEQLVRAVRLGRRTRRFFAGNLVWAFGYNALLLPVAAGILVPFGIRLSPGLAALAMSLSSVSVLANSLRLLRVRL
jgi:Cu+-exporting ATPase